MRNAFTSAAALGLLALFAGCDSDSRASRDAHQRGVEAMEYDDYETAASEFQQAIEHDPERLETRELRAECLEQIENYEEAVSELSASIRLTVGDDEKKAALRCRRGKAYYNVGEHADAVRDFDKVLFGNPRHGEALLYRGFAYHGLGWEREAIASLDAAENTFEATNDDLYAMRGEAHEALGHDNKALEDYTRAIEMDDEDAMNFIRRGQFHQEHDRYRAALADFNRAIQAGDDPGPGLQRRARLQLAHDHFDAAVADMERAIGADPGNYSYTEELAQWYRDRGDFENLIRVYSDAIAASKRSDAENRRNQRGYRYYPYLGWYLARCRTYLAMHEYDRALADALKSVDLNEESFYGHELAGRVYEALGQYDNALASYEEAQAQSSWSTTPKVGKARIYYQLGRFDECRAICSELLEDRSWVDEPENFEYHLDGDLAEAEYLLAKLHADRGDQAAAWIALRYAEYLNPHAAEQLRKNAVVQRQLADEPAAVMSEYRAIRAEGLSPRIERD